MDANQQQKLAEFCSITGADTERAEFFLQAAGWDTNVAISTFFEDEGGSSVDPTPHPAASTGVTPVAAGSSQSTSQSQDSAQPSAPSQSGRRIQTFSHWAGANQPEHDSDDEGHAYFAGGSEHSGQQILGPPKKGAAKGDKVVEELFKAARQHGAEEVSDTDRSKKSQRSHFVGTGYRLGESESEVSHVVAGAAKSKQAVNVILRLWKTGFTINDAPLRPFSEPQNRQFLDNIHRGEIPQELISMAEGAQVALDMEDHSSEEYTPPKRPKVIAFAGSGQALGSESSPKPSTSSAVAGSSAVAVIVDPSLPVTNVQIRLADGSRLVGRFNHSHTIADVRRHIVASRPQYAGVAFSLITTLPSRQLTDDSTTLKEADLLNASIMQKL